MYHLNFHVQISVTYIFYLQDQRILELMMMKGEGEISANRDRFVADLAWEEQRKLEEEVKVRTEMKRRQMLAEENRIRDMKKVGKQDDALDRSEKMHFNITALQFIFDYFSI